MQGLLHLAGIAVAHRDERTGPEHLAHDGGVLEQGLSFRQSVSRRAAISAWTESGTSTVLVELAPVGEQAHELLRVQRVAARPLEQLLSSPRAAPPARAAPDEARRLLLGERGEVDPLRVPGVGAEGRVPLVQLRPGGAERGGAGRPRAQLGQVLEEGEECLVRPVQVLEDEHRLPPLGPRLENRRHAVNDSSCEAGSPPAPTSGSEARFQPGDVGVVGGSAPSSLAAASSGVSVSRIPHSALTISPSAQNAMPSP